MNFTMAKQKTHARSQKVAKSDSVDKALTPIFFYMPYDSPCGCFCQWRLSPFTVKLRSFDYLGTLPDDIDAGTEITFNCAEQYMMYAKALYFKDPDTGKRILRTDDPKEQKKLGKAVKGFWDGAWSEVREKVAEEGNWAKFITIDNGHMKDILLGTGDRELCEASSQDRIWGIGYKEKDARPMALAGRRESWGLNLLGKALMKVRERLRVEHKA